MGKRKSDVAHMKSMSFETLTPAQVLMRDEMAAGVHQPVRVDALMREEFGPVNADADITAVALDIINEGPNVRLSFSQWAIIQNLVERGIQAGVRLGQAR